MNTNYYRINFDDYNKYKETEDYKKIFKDVYRQKKRLNNFGIIETEFLRIDDINFYKNIDSLLEFKINWYKKNNIDINKIFSNLKNFYIKICLCNEFYKAEVSVTKVNNEIIAGCIGFIKDGVYYYIYPSYSDDWNIYSPGKIHLLSILDYYNLKGYLCFDLSIGDEIYKKKLHPKFLSISKISIYNGYLGFFLYLIIKLSNVKKYIKIFRFKFMSNKINKLFL